MIECICQHFNHSLQEHYDNWAKLQALANTVRIDYVSDNHINIHSIATA